MTATFVVVPEWQGSGSARAMRLGEGAEAISGDLPASATRHVPVPSGPGESLDTGVRRYSSLLKMTESLLEELAATRTTPLVIGGGCAIALGAVEHSHASTDGDLALVWFDAHPDLNTPETSPSGAFGGMVLRTLLGDGAEGLVPRVEHRLLPSKIVLCGARDIDPEEERYIAANAIPLIEELESPTPLLDAVRATGATRMHIHIDLDVLDPAVIMGVDYPVPFGLAVEQVTAAITALRGEFELVGASLAGFAPSTPAAAIDDLPGILRIIGALTKG